MQNELQNENDIYFKKYLKYKQKYSDLKKLIGGGKCSLIYPRCYGVAKSNAKHVFGNGLICLNCGCKRRNNFYL